MKVSRIINKQLAKYKQMRLCDVISDIPQRKIFYHQVEQNSYYYGETFLRPPLEVDAM